MGEGIFGWVVGGLGVLSFLTGHECVFLGDGILAAEGGMERSAEFAAKADVFVRHGGGGDGGGAGGLFIKDSGAGYS